MSAEDTARLDIVVPFLDEENNVPVLYERICSVLEEAGQAFSIIFVDDGSTDGTPEWVAARAREDTRVKLLRLSRNFGHQVAITAGMDYASAEAVVIMDADLQDPPEVIPQLVAKWREGFDVVYAVRSKREGESWMKRFLAAMFYRVFHRLANVDVPMDAGDFRLVDRKVVDALKRVREMHRFVRGLTHWVGFSQGAVYYERAARHAGETKYPVLKSVKLAWDAITSFSGVPLRYVMVVGFITAVGGVLLALRIIVLRLLHPGILQPGWASLAALTLFIGGIQLFCIGLLGQYVSRVFEETKKRPLYLVKETAGDFDQPADASSSA